jgi:hypothetical protein
MSNAKPVRLVLRRNCHARRHPPFLHAVLRHCHSPARPASLRFIHLVTCVCISGALGPLVCQVTFKRRDLYVCSSDVDANCEEASCSAGFVARSASNTGPLGVRTGQPQLIPWPGTYHGACALLALVWVAQCADSGPRALE